LVSALRAGAQANANLRLLVLAANNVYDDADRLTSVTDLASNTTQYVYDTENNLLSITDANGHATHFSYNPRGWITQTAFPSSQAESYTYDAVGNLTSKTDRKGNAIQYVYDVFYRVTQKMYPDKTSVEYAYDLAGKIQQVVDPTGNYGFAYDNMGRLIGTTAQNTFLPLVTETNSYTYDAASNRTLTAPDGSISTYGYDTEPAERRKLHVRYRRKPHQQGQLSQRGHVELQLELTQTTQRS
jgi:YD repeat-containing protein